MRLKPSLSLSLALWLGASSAPSLAAPSSSPSFTLPADAPRLAAAPKKKKPVAAPVAAPAPVEEPLPEAPPAPPPPPLSALPATPWAGRTLVLAWPATPAEAAEATRLQSRLREALGAQADVVLVDPVTRFPAPPPRSLERGDVLFAEGKDLYDNLDPEGAAKKFSAAASYYQLLPVDMNPERLARVYIFLGASRLLDGDAAAAQGFFSRAVLAEPRVRPESELFGQDVDAAFTAAKEALEKGTPGTLTVDSVPAGARVTVHGETLGTTPLKDVKLPPGPHQVVLTLPGHLPFGVFQEVAADKAAELKPTLTPVPGMDTFLTLSAQVATSPTLDGPAAAEAAPAEVVALAGKVDARYVVLARVDQAGKAGPGATLYAWDVKSKNRLRGVKWDPAVRTEQQRVVGQVNDFVTGKFSTSPFPPAVVEVVKKPWFWAAVGGVAVATTAGIVLANQGGRPLGARLGNFGAGW